MILKTEIMKFFNDYDYCRSGVNINEITDSITVNNNIDNNIANANSSSSSNNNIENIDNDINERDCASTAIHCQYYSVAADGDKKRRKDLAEMTSPDIMATEASSIDDDDDDDICDVVGKLENTEKKYFQQSFQNQFVVTDQSVTGVQMPAKNGQNVSIVIDQQQREDVIGEKALEEELLLEDTIVKTCSCLNEHDDSSCSLTDDSGLESAASSWGKSVAEVNEHAFAKLEEELYNARETLKLRDEEVSKLSLIRQEVESELQDLTASLFQEAHSMVREANVKQAAAEKALKESHMKVEVLTAEVSALKTLVLTSTPSKPNLHLHNQSHNNTAKCKQESPSTAGLFKKQHYRSPSHYDLKYGRESPSSASSSTEEIFTLPQPDPLEVTDGYEIDPNVNNEFMLWKENPTLDRNCPFVSRIYSEDIDLCLSFNNAALEAEVKNAIINEDIYIEAVDKAKSQFPKKCALMDAPRLCHYRMKIGNCEEYHYISQICRNRIIAVCNFLNYLRYIQRGLVKSSVHDMYWEIIKLRKEITLARLGLPASSESY